MSAENMAALKTFFSLVMAFTALFAAACAVTPDQKPAAATGPTPIIARQFGQVASVNTAGRYVVLECAALPKEGEEITLYNGIGQTGRVKINRHTSGNFAAADILDGEPATGDTFAIPPERPIP